MSGRHGLSKSALVTGVALTVFFGGLGLIGGVVEPLIGGLIATTVFPGFVYVLETLFDEGAHS